MIVICQQQTGRALRLVHHRVLTSERIAYSTGTVHVVGAVGVVSPAPATAPLGTVISLIPGTISKNRCFNLYISAMNRILAGLIEVNIVRSFGTDTLLFAFGGDQLTTAQEKADYFLSLFIQNESTSVNFRQSEGDATLGNLYQYKAIYGLAGVESFKGKLLRV